VSRATGETRGTALARRQCAGRLPRWARLILATAVDASLVGRAANPVAADGGRKAAAGVSARRAKTAVPRFRVTDLAVRAALVTADNSSVTTKSAVVDALGSGRATFTSAVDHAGARAAEAGRNVDTSLTRRAAIRAAGEGAGATRSLVLVYADSARRAATVAAARGAGGATAAVGAADRRCRGTTHVSIADLTRVATEVSSATYITRVAATERSAECFAAPGPRQKTSCPARRQVAYTACKCSGAARRTEEPRDGGAEPARAPLFGTTLAARDAGAVLTGAGEERVPWRVGRYNLPAWFRWALLWLCRGSGRRVFWKCRQACSRAAGMKLGFRLCDQLLYGGLESRGETNGWRWLSIGKVNGALIQATAHGNGDKISLIDRSGHDTVCDAERSGLETPHCGAVNKGHGAGRIVRSIQRGWSEARIHTHNELGAARNLNEADDAEFRGCRRGPGQ